LINGYQMIVAVLVNHSGPYDFLLDTGTQFTMIDPLLAAELQLSRQDSIPVDGTGFHASSFTATLDRLEVRSHSIAHLEAVVFNLQNLRLLDLRVRGILGEDFLQHFDVLIDNTHQMLCLDDSAVMRLEVKGRHIALATWSETDDVPPNSLIVAVRLSQVARPLRLKLDSGASAPALYNASPFKPVTTSRDGSLRGSGTDGLQRAFVALPPQEVKIGPLKLADVPFFAPAGAKEVSSTLDFDGLLTLRLFRRVFICHSDHFVVLEPR
jgi:hypothetical protein